MRKTLIRSTAAAFAGLLVLASAATAQSRLEERLDPETMRSVSRVLEQAAVHGIAAGPLRNKALEGAGKGADGPMIVKAVERLYERMAVVHGALGGSASAEEQLAGAALLDLGLDSAAIAVVGAAAARRPATSALVGLAFLVQRGVPPARSVPLVRDMLEARATDADFAAFQRLVDQDVRAGLPVTGAADARGRAIIRHGSRLRSYDRPEV